MSFSSLLRSSWHRMAGLKKFIWIHVLSAVIVSLFVLAALHFSLSLEDIKALSMNRYMPMYAVVLLLFVPFVCFAIKTVIDKKSTHLYLFAYVYAEIPSMTTAFYLGCCVVLVFYALFCLKVWLLTWVLSTALIASLLLLYDVLQAVLWIVGSLAVATSLARSRTFLPALKAAWCVCRRHAATLLLLVLCLYVIFFLLGFLGYLMLSHWGASGSLISLLFHALVYVMLVPYVIVLVTQIESQSPV